MPFHPVILFKNYLHQNPCPPLKNEAPPESEKQTHHWKAKRFQGNDSQKKSHEKWETIINTCASIIKQHWKKMAEIPQERDFLTCTIQNLVRKVKQFVRKYYITVKHL